MATSSTSQDTAPFRDLVVATGHGEARLVQLAEELAMGLRPAGDIWRDHGVHDKAEAASLLSLPAFADMIREFRATWTSSHKLTDRIRIRALMALEHSLLTLYRDANAATHPLSSRVSALTFLAKLGGIGQEAQGAVTGPGGGGVTIRIDLSSREGEERVVTIDGNLDDSLVGDPSSSSSLGAGHPSAPSGEGEDEEEDVLTIDADV